MFLRSSPRSAVVVIAPPDVPVQVRAQGAPVVRFTTSAEFERWSHESSARVAAAVYAALAQLSIDLSRCSPRIQEVFTALCERESIPSVKELLASCSSRRSFYRSWNADISEAPAAFLTRVRLLHLRARAARDDSAAQGGTSDASRAVR